MKYFPALQTKKRNGIFEAAAGLKMQSIIHGHLLLPEPEFRNNDVPQLNRMKPLSLHRQREGLLHALAGMAPDLVLELHLISEPDLSAYSGSKIFIILFLRSNGCSAAKAREKIIRGYLALKPVLAVHLPEAVFVPIFDSEELESLSAPFKARSVQSLERRRESLNLELPLHKEPIGFEARADKPQAAPLIVDHVFPWLPAGDDWECLLNTMTAQLDPVKIVIRLQVAKRDHAAEKRLAEIVNICDDFRLPQASARTILLRQAGMIRDISLRRLSELAAGSFHLGVFLLTSNENCAPLVNVLGHSITALPLGNNGEYWSGGFKVRKVGGNKERDLHFFRDDEPYSITEAACAFRIPSPPMADIPGLTVQHFRTSFAMLPKNQPDKGVIILGMNEHQGIRQVIEQNADDRMRHTFIVGQTGTGKSTLMEYLCLHDIYAGNGLAVIDPHGEMVDAILGKIPPERAGDVILVDFLDKERPFGFNLLEWQTLEERDLLIDELFMSINQIYDLKQTGGPVFESNFRGMLKLLMGDAPRKGFNATILEFPLCYLYNDFRTYLKKGIQDKRILDFVTELERTDGETSLSNLASYITSKFSRFTQDVTLQGIIGQEHTSFDFMDVMDSGKILLLKLGKGRFGSVVSSLLANQIVSRFKMAAMKRGELAPERRRDFYLYVDECHNLPVDNFTELLSESRKYRMGLILATQYMAQLSKSVHGSRDNLLAAILGNVGTNITFRLGMEDAAHMAVSLAPSFTVRDIMGLPNRHGYIRTQAANQAVPPFSFQNIKSDRPFVPKIAAEIKEMSQLRYGRSRESVNTQIAARRDIWKN